MKTYKNYIFVEFKSEGVKDDVSDGYLKSIEGDERIKLPHRNFTLLGIVDECINAPYAEEFSKDIVSYASPREGYGGFCNYEVEAWCHHLETAIESFKTLMKKLDLKPTDYILRDDTK